MSKKIKDTDYLVISARIKAMENSLLTQERMEQILEARTDEEAAKVLVECGYEELPALTHAGLDELLSAARADRLLRSSSRLASFTTARTSRTSAHR